MLRSLAARLKLGHRTIPFPKGEPVLPDRFRGLPVIDPERCAKGCGACAAACPTGAILVEPGRPPRIDLGKCLFCMDCQEACPQGAVSYLRDHRLAVRRREDLVVEGKALRLAEALERKARRLFGRSLKLRQVSAGGCNGCEADVNVLNTVVFDLGRFGVQFVASPRHADGVLITGPVPRNMSLALRKTWEAIPSPRLAIAVGACAISGGPFIGHPETEGGAGDAIPIDLYVPGCPPHPLTILDGILRLLGKVVV
jgi:Ni,Fe-hydrogenase III small subunit/ferredoxin